MIGEAELKIKGKRIQIRQLLRDFLRLAALRVIGPDALASPERQGYHSAQSIWPFLKYQLWAPWTVRSHSSSPIHSRYESGVISWPINYLPTTHPVGIRQCNPKAPEYRIQGLHEYWSGLPFPSPGDLTDPGIEPGSPALQVNFSPTEPLTQIWERGQALNITLVRTSTFLKWDCFCDQKELQSSEIWPRFHQGQKCICTVGSQELRKGSFSGGQMIWFRL